MDCILGGVSTSEPSLFEDCVMKAGKMGVSTRDESRKNLELHNCFRSSTKQQVLAGVQYAVVSICEKRVVYL